jgi:glycosyltransferase involved in cell wall biosynthesis
MKYSFIIPIYLSRSSKEGWREGDTVYDHPTPINEKGTLVKTLESLKSISTEMFDVILLVSTTTPDIEMNIEQWVKDRLKEASYVPRNIYLYSHADLDVLTSKISKKITEDHNTLLSLRGYSQVRNIGFIAAILHKVDALIWLDDDELVQDKMFIKKIDEGLNKKINGKKVRLITGACPEGEKGGYIRIRETKPWMIHWNKIKYQNEAFEKIIGTNPRFKVSPFAHGGLSIIHKDVFTKIPYDPYVQRGEDMDLNMNARMFGYSFYLDNTLEIRHCPPPRVHPQWKRVREDMIRYLWQRNKILSQKKQKGLKLITAEEFDPYPGAFLKKDLEEMIFKSQSVLATEYLIEGKASDAKEAIENIRLASKEPLLLKNAFVEYLQTQKNWVSLVAELNKINISLKKL